MNTPLTKLKTAAEHLRLSHEEKEVMRAKIFTAIDAAKYEPRYTSRATYSWFSLRYAVSLGMVCVVMLGSTAYAAESALPGEPLYSIKLYVNESVAEALAVSPAAKVAFHTSRAEVRLKEAEALASEGRLDEETTAQIEESFDKHIARADELALALTEDDEDAALEASVRLESTLSVHSAILARLGGESSDEGTRENSSRVAERALARSVSGRGGVMALKTASPEAVSLSLMAEPATDATSNDAADTSEAHIRYASGEEDGDVKKEAASKLKGRVEDELREVKKAFASLEAELSATTTALIEERLDILDDLVEGGASELEAEMLEAARVQFGEALRGALELSALIEANGVYKRDFFAWPHQPEEEERETEREESEEQERERDTLDIPLDIDIRL